MGRHYFKWTRDAVMRLAEIAPAMTNKQAALDLG